MSASLESFLLRSLGSLALTKACQVIDTKVNNRYYSILVSEKQYSDNLSGVFLRISPLPAQRSWLAFRFDPGSAIHLKWRDSICSLLRAWIASKRFHRDLEFYFGVHTTVPEVKEDEEHMAKRSSLVSWNAKKTFIQRFCQITLTQHANHYR